MNQVEHIEFQKLELKNYVGNLLVNNQEMVSINPVLVIGQVIPDHNKYAGNVDLGTSNLQIKQLVTGETKTIQKKLQGFVDVKDVARAHVRAMQVPHANGNRYLCCSEITSFIRMGII
jgi:nucleoside-diphosphate-sugar epimerase